VTALHLISRYAGAEESLAPLHRLGSDQWDKAKRRAAEKAYDVAAELLNIYARREANPRFRFGEPGADYQRFAEQFAFELTTGSAQAIDEVIGDLCSDRATDRLVCGDVGFGKTEVAMRAAFVAVQSGKQVAVWCPPPCSPSSTSTPCGTASPIGRCRSRRCRGCAPMPRSAKWCAHGQRTGRHRGGHPQTAQPCEVVSRPGPGDHRRGASLRRAAERAPEVLRAEVDVLTLTATPIPRTLNMAMSGLRELSIIATPPARRLSIKTFVMEKRRHVIQEAVTRELMRGGQVFYLHNEVKTIATVADELAERIPEARIGIGHGQMPKRELERVMNDFYHRQLNVLVCTTIIENGIDIPNANTIVIERADRFGLAQLHQLRGRVGRSHRQAYAYLLTPHPKAMTPTP
jgi:transcription-repair coupling factor (superfamily II helicase)